MILQVDIGNTRIKWRVCDGGRRVQAGVLQRSGELPVPELAQAPTQVWIASVAGEQLEAQLRGHINEAWNIEPWFARTAAAACGLTNSYAEPQRMGVDRWLAMLAAWNDGQSELCVIDAGSALTIDFVSAEGLHQGGYILPGQDSMERALLSDTDRVRFGNAPVESLVPGQSTEQAVYNGIQLSQVGAVATALNRYGAACQIYFCGGNGATLHDLLGRGGVIQPDLVLDGLALLAGEELAMEATE